MDRQQLRRLGLIGLVLLGLLAAFYALTRYQASKRRAQGNPPKNRWLA